MCVIYSCESQTDERDWVSLVLKSTELPSCLDGYEKILNLFLSTYVMNLKSSCMNSLEVLAEEVMFGVWVCVSKYISPSQINLIFTSIQEV